MHCIFCWAQQVLCTLKLSTSMSLKIDINKSLQCNRQEWKTFASEHASMKRVSMISLVFQKRFELSIHCILKSRIHLSGRAQTSTAYLFRYVRHSFLASKRGASKRGNSFDLLYTLLNNNVPSRNLRWIGLFELWMSLRKKYFTVSRSFYFKCFVV